MRVRIMVSLSSRTMRLSFIIIWDFQAADRFAFLLGYENCWPVSDVIRQQLKYTSGRARLEAIKYEAENARMRRRARF